MTDAADGAPTSGGAQPFCSRCGAVDHPRSEAICRCAQTLGSVDENRGLLDLPLNGIRDLQRVQALATPVVREHFEAVAQGEPSEWELATALHVLGSIADPRSFDVVTAHAAGDELPGGVARYLSRVGTVEAIDLLATWLDRGSDAALTGLAHVGDVRAAPGLLQLVSDGTRVKANLELLGRIDAAVWFDDLLALFERHVATMDQRIEAHTGSRVMYSDPAVLRRRLEERFGAEGMDDPAVQMLLRQNEQQAAAAAQGVRDTEAARNAVVRDLWAMAVLLDAADPVRTAPALAAAAPAVAEDLVARIEANRELVLSPVTDHDLGAEPAVEARVLDYQRGDAAHPGTRFGGQPTWLGPPTWPTGTFGTPMSFWAQIRLPDDPERMAYVFLDTNDAMWDDDDGLPSTGSVFLQPGGAPTGPWDPRATGPVVPDTSSRDDGWKPPLPWSFDARVPTLERFQEPITWEEQEPEDREHRIREARSWNKVGGTPNFLQGEPELEGWEFLCQFGAYEAGYELADVAACYVFIDRAAGTGVLTWDCH